MRTPIRLSAWAATGTSRLCASSTAAAISSMVSCGWPACRPVVIIPPVAISLIERRAAPEVLAGRAADSIRAVRLPADPPAVSAGHRDDPAAREHVRPGDLAGGDERGELDRHLARSADVADRRHPGAHGRLEPGDAAHEGLAPVLAVERRSPGPARRPGTAWAWAFISPGVSHRPPRATTTAPAAPWAAASRPSPIAAIRPARTSTSTRPGRAPRASTTRASLQEEVGHTRSLAQRPLRVAPDPP